MDESEYPNGLSKVRHTMLMTYWKWNVLNCTDWRHDQPNKANTIKQSHNPIETL